MAAHNELGRYGEDIAKHYLQEKGYHVVNQNWIYGRAEIDLIAFYESKLIFIEVKTRSSVTHGEPEDFVNHKKERQLEFASLEYIERIQHQGEIRFDVVAIVITKDKQFKINHIEDAFWPG
jgi:putative endonuclease